ncbi:epimerase [Seohaeicola zhoushanensis]
MIVNAWNPLYTDWAEQVPGLTQKVIKVAQQTGATVIVPGNVYVFGEQTPAPWSERTPHGATNGLGRVRIAMEAAYRASGVRTIVLRAGDFIDAGASGNWFDRILVARLDRGVVQYPGNPDIPHAWAWLPDVARAAVLLAEQRESLPAFTDVPFPGYTLTGRELVAALSRVTGRGLQLKRFSYLPLHLLRPVWPMARRLVEMSYLWRRPHWLDGARFQELLPGFRHTQLEAALAVAIGAGVAEVPEQAVTAR